MKVYEKNKWGDKPNPVVKEILDGIEIGVVLLNREEKIIFANKASEDILQYKREFLLGKRLLSLFPPRVQELDSREGNGQIFFHNKRGDVPLKLLIVPYHDSQ